jgi:hypothetical protein
MRKKKKNKKREFEFSSMTTNEHGFLELLIADSISISVRDKKALYVTIGDCTYYIDDSTGEQIFHKFKTN